MNRRPAANLLNVVKFILPLAVIGWLLWRIEPEQWMTLRQQPKDYGRLAAALLAAMVALTISFTRWWVLVRCQGIPLRLVESYRLSAIGFLLSFVSAGSVGGDVFKMVFLARRSPGKQVQAVASVLVDRGIGLLGLLILVVAALQLAGDVRSEELARIGQISLILTAIGLVGLAGLILGGKPIDRLLAQTARWGKLGAIIDQVVSPLRMFHHHPWAFAGALLATLGVHSLLAVSVYWIALGLYADQAPPLIDHFLISPIANLASALPIAPAGIGVLEAAMEWLYRAVPVVPTAVSGTLVGLVFELVKVNLAILGMLFYWTAGSDIRRSLAQTRAQAAAADLAPDAEPGQVPADSVPADSVPAGSVPAEQASAEQTAAERPRRDTDPRA